MVANGNPRYRFFYHRDSFLYSFLTGMSKAAWDLRIIDDGLMENTENLAVYIQQPVNAVLGRRRKMRIRLINAEDGM